MTAGSPVPDRPPQLVAIGLIQDAEGYRKAALRLCNENKQVDTDLRLPAYFLLCHSAELLLKAFLTTHGALQGSKKGGLKSQTLRHNLLGLYEAALTYGFTPPDESFGELMDWLTPYHHDHVFRYRETGRILLPTPWLIAQSFAPAIAKIEHEVRFRFLVREPGQKG